MNEGQHPSWHKRLTTGPFQSRTFSLKHIQKIEAHIAGRTKAKRTLATRIVTGVLGAAIILLMVLVFIPQSPFHLNAGRGSITDEATEEMLTSVLPKGNQFVVNTMYDNMDRGHHELEKQAVVDPDYYRANALKRGDIVYYNGAAVNHRLQPGELSRVVGLPGETVRIQQGQLFIDGKRLDTFYGKALMGGYDRQAFLAIPESPNINHAGIMKDVFDFSMNELTIPQDAVFLVGDDWSRSVDGRITGPIPIDLINGKVVGICPSCSVGER
ncbi:MAG: signal peptidase I [Cohnella sp.]|nr:signal peptidase I [Cohnella sp.]